MMKETTLIHLCFISMRIDPKREYDKKEGGSELIIP